MHEGSELGGREEREGEEKRVRRGSTSVTGEGSPRLALNDGKCSMSDRVGLNEQRGDDNQRHGLKAMGASHPMSSLLVSKLSLLSPSYPESYGRIPSHEQPSCPQAIPLVSKLSSRSSDLWHTHDQFSMTITSSQ